MQRVGDQLFTRTALTLNQHVHGTFANLIDQPDKRLYLRAHADDVAQMQDWPMFDLAFAARP